MVKKIYVVSEERIIKNGVIYNTAETGFSKKINAEAFCKLKPNAKIRILYLYD